jgi:hypothetical protein
MSNIQDLLENHNIARVGVTNFGLLEADLTLKSSVPGFAKDQFSGSPIKHTTPLLTQDDIDAVKAAIDDTTEQGQAFLSIIADHQAALLAKDFAALLAKDFREPPTIEIYPPTLTPPWEDY